MQDYYVRCFTILLSVCILGKLPIKINSLSQGVWYNRTIPTKKGNKMQTKEYTIDDLYESVEDMYMQLQSEKISYENAREILKRCCEAFILNDPNR